MTDRSAPGIGGRFGPYRIESLLGRGGMGAVYLATHERLGRRVALKVIAPALALDEEFRARFLRESQLAASLDHPNVIPIYDADEVDGVLYLAMRYVSGPSLRALIGRHGPMSAADALRMAEQIGGALDAAHGEGLVHRDVKPANILLAERGNHAYLCDFGLAKRTSSKGTTRTGSFLGSVDYCAPEQIEGRPLDGRADIYSLGCVLFQCLAGDPPFVGDTELAVAQAHLHDAPPALSALRPDLPGTLDAVLATALAKDPDHRHQTAGALASAFAKALAGERASADRDATRAAPVARTPAEPAPDLQETVVTTPARKRSRRRTLLVGAVILALAAGAIAAAFGALERSNDGSSADTAALRTFVDRIENVLEQSAAGRGEVSTALTAGRTCSISAEEAARRIASAADNRQSILGQLGGIQAPTQQADDVVTLLQRAVQQSIEADRHYRDGFLSVVEPNRRCPLPPNRDFELAAASDARATAAKRGFVAALNPLAEQFHRRTWTPAEI